MITAALRTGLPLSSLITTKFSTAVGSSASSRCAAAVPRRVKTDSRPNIIHVFIFIVPTSGDFISGHSSARHARTWGRKWCRDGLRLPGGAAFAFHAAGLSCELDEVIGDACGIVPGDTTLVQVVAQHGDHAQSFDS